MISMESNEIPTDKRTKAYKEYVKRQAEQSKGVGDTIAKATKATGIDKAVKFVAGEDCGCAERQERLNEVIRYDTPKCLTEDEFNYLTKFFNNVPEKINTTTQNQLLEIHNRIYKKQLKFTTCCIGELIRRLRKVIEVYKKK